MADWSKPILSSLYLDVLGNLKSRDEDVANQFVGGATNLPVGVAKFDYAAATWKKWTGTAWENLSNRYMFGEVQVTDVATFGSTVMLSHDPATAMEAATKHYVDGLLREVTIIVGKFGKTKKPSDLPVNGIIPKDWDDVGVPARDIIMLKGQSLIFRPDNTSDPLYGHVFVFVTVDFNAAGWVDIGPVQGPKGDTGPQGPKGDTGSQGPEGKQGPVGKEGPEGKQGIQGPEGKQGIQGPEGKQGDVGPKGDQGIQGNKGDKGDTGAAARIMGAFGTSKAPADLPLNGLIPKDWDAPGVPPGPVQLYDGDAMLFNRCAEANPLFGHLFSYCIDAPDGPNFYVDAGKIAGPKGDKGDQGIQGIQGPKGDQGIQGQKGDQGIQGPKGDQGIQGPEGPRGSDGAQGPKGDKGDQGIQGPKGDPGSDANVTTENINRALGYLPPGRAGQDATGNWNINIAGNALTATTAANGGVTSVNGKKGDVIIQAGGFDAGTRVLFQQSAAPTGWTKDTTHNDKAIRVVNGTVGSGGEVGFTAAFAHRTPTGAVNVQVNVSGLVAQPHTLTVDELATHAHGFDYPKKQTQGSSGTGDKLLYTPPEKRTTTNAGHNAAHSHSVSGTASGSGTFTGDAMNFAVQYVDVIICTKD